MKIENMVFYFDLNHPTELLKALSLVYKLDRNNKFDFRHYKSSEYGNEVPGSVFFIVDEEKRGLEITTKRMAADGYTVFALKFSEDNSHIPFTVSEAILKMWSRVLNHVTKPNQSKLYKYHYSSDTLRPVETTVF